ncbi:unnamed protein product [Clonostachys rosea f. rosea IK726]|uniref:Amino acid permease/ SLC12A domain-containing protein n=2 Tax=Bionectria ochroleuca TaxID=29856 RepID=A0A0B7JZ45_BIOOC|nr:unnamed protein product [Clonostachys rosea f. rosea IK726]
MSSEKDENELEAAGYESQMPRRFSLWSLGALSFTMTGTWQGTGSSMGIGLRAASSGGVMWSLLVAGTMTTVVAAGMAELASAYPVSGAQYYWSYMVASDDYRAFAAFLVIGWWFSAGAVANFVAGTILNIVVAWNTDYEPQAWQKYLLFVTFVWLAASFNIFAANWIPYFNKMMFVFALITMTSTMVTMFVVARGHHQSAEFIFTNMETHTGWSSDGFGFLLAMGNAVYAFMGGDCAAKLAEEIPNPSKNVPLVTIFPVVTGFLTAFPFAGALLYAIKDIDSVLNTATGLPLFEIYLQATESKLAASVLLGVFSMFQFSTLIASTTTGSRTVWAVSRDDVLPFSHLWQKVNPYFDVPVNSMLLSATFITAYGLIFLGSTTAFSAMVNATIIFIQTSIVLPQAIVLFRGRDRILPPRWFNLGRYGVIINALSVLWVFGLNILFCFPTTLPITAMNMNYVPIVVSVATASIFVFWFMGKKNSFTGPVIDMKALDARRKEAMDTDSTLNNAGHESDGTIVEGDLGMEKNEGVKIKELAN